MCVCVCAFEGGRGQGRPRHWCRRRRRWRCHSVELVRESSLDGRRASSQVNGESTSGLTIQRIAWRVWRDVWEGTWGRACAQFNCVVGSCVKRLRLSARWVLWPTLCRVNWLRRSWWPVMWMEVGEKEAPRKAAGVRSNAGHFPDYHQSSCRRSATPHSGGCLPQSTRQLLLVCLRAWVYGGSPAPFNSTVARCIEVQSSSFACCHPVFWRWS